MSRPAGSRGFTLIELAVTLLVLSLAAAVVVPGIGRSIGSVRARAEISGFAAYLRAAREQAITRGQAQSVRLDPETRSLVITAAGSDAVRSSRSFTYLMRIESDPARCLGGHVRPAGLLERGHVPHPRPRGSALRRDRRSPDRARVEPAGRFLMARGLFSDRGGFTLLEVLIAFAILAVGVVSLIQLTSQGLRLLKVSGDHQQAVQLADRLARDTQVLAEEAKSEPAVETGEEGAFAWERRVTRVALPEELEPQTPVPGKEVPGLYSVAVAVRWGHNHMVEVATLRAPTRRSPPVER